MNKKEMLEIVDYSDEESEEVLNSSNEIDSDDLSVSSSSLQMKLPFKREALDEKEYKSFIKSCERLVRASPEYREFIKFARESYNADVCALTNENNDETDDIEIHHYPFTLYDLCQIVVDNKLLKGEKFASFDIALEVITLHFGMYIGFVPLSGTLHKKYHNGFLDIPIQAVKGNYAGLLELYDVDLDLIAKVNLAKQITHTPYERGWLTNRSDGPKMLGEDIDLNKQVPLNTLNDDPCDLDLESKIDAYNNNPLE